METHFLKEALFGGMTSNAFKLGTALTLGWFWPRISGCSALYRGHGMEQIDFENILAVAELNAGEISPPGYLPHNNNETYFYVIRRVNSCGHQEHTIAAAVKVSIDTDGDLAKPQPNKIFAVKTIQVDANKIRIVWFYCPIEQMSKPARFNVYFDAATEQINYENPVASFDYKGRRFYSYLSDTLTAGIYQFAIRAEDASGVENGSLSQLKIQLDITNPDAIDILSAEAI
jgi:hypothetical protein